MCFNVRSSMCQEKKKPTKEITCDIRYEVSLAYQVTWSRSKLKLRQHFNK